ncbi:hypothetical protein BDQ12DRAFT_107798 [Crucibulum laeve]|uniref:Uncharacterized protein n=1 Tax=Crucibulum laeve TaxID=68775 RepID=A0A5C3LFW4_9AGAR|nr:hypothetical protein BDQ12DRAFT_107798 [Crucibulum laeve]
MNSRPGIKYASGGTWFDSAPGLYTWLMSKFILRGFSLLLAFEGVSEALNYAEHRSAETCEVKETLEGGDIEWVVVLYCPARLFEGVTWYAQELIVGIRVGAYFWEAAEKSNEGSWGFEGGEYRKRRKGRGEGGVGVEEKEERSAVDERRRKEAGRHRGRSGLFWLNFEKKRMYVIEK